MAALIAGVPPHRWSSPSPCPEWTVEDLVVHLIAGNVKYRDIAAGGDFWPGVPDVELGAGAAATYRLTAGEMIEAWRQPGALEREIGLPRGRRGRAEVALFIHLSESVGHGWDLARATGQDPGFDDDVVEACLESCRGRMAAQRDAQSPYADAREVGEGGALVDQLAAFLGRDVTAWRR